MSEAVIFTVETGDVRMRYVRFGKGGHPFVILPGLSMKSVLNSGDAIAAAYADFADDYTVYLFDRRENAPEEYPVSAMAADTAAAMKELGICDADIFGASQGGMIAQYIAIHHPELVHRLVLGSSISRPNATTEEVLARWHTLAAEGKVQELVADSIDRIYSQAFLAQFREILLQMHAVITDEELHRFRIFSGAAFNTYEDLPKIQCPVFVIGCEGDQVTTGAASVEMAEKLGCELYMYGPEYGHGVYDEAPDYRSRILEFLHKVF